ncbi:MAG: cytochrome c peroxidase [Gammaproteobacteria bacterium]
MTTAKSISGPGRAAATVIALMGLALGSWWFAESSQTGPWSGEELRTLESLWLGALPPLAADPSNEVADDPSAAALGHRLFFDTRLSANEEVACATCHQPAKYFTDGLPRGQGLGTSRRNTISLVGAAYSPWFYWDGRKDSLWSQALSPLEDSQEHGGTRLQLARVIYADAAYRMAYRRLFGPLPDLSNTQRFPLADGDVPSIEDRQLVTQVFVNIGKSIAAYERLLSPGATRFDNYVEAVRANDIKRQQELFSSYERAGLRLFIGKASCTQCHNGPLLTNNAFHNTGVLSARGQVPDKGRIEGVRIAQADPFNCLGRYSDAPRTECAELVFAKTDVEVLGALRAPSLRSVEYTAPYMHAGQLATLDAVLEHYNQAPLAMIGHNEAKPLGLSRREIKQLRAFLSTLNAPPAVDRKWLQPPS